MPNGFYLVNGLADGDRHRSGMAYYNNLDQASVGAQPDQYVDVGNAGHYIVWENETIEGIFPGGAVVTVNIIGDAQSKGFQEVVGSASNQTQTFQVFKDDNREVFEQGGFTFHTVYFCR